MRPKKKNLEHKLTSLDKVDSPECKAFTKKCRDWTKLEENQDKRGTKAAATKEAYNACKWFKAAQKYQEHEDSSISQEARKTVKGVLYQEFPEICKRLRTLHGQASKTGKRIIDQRLKAAEQVVRIDDRYDLQELRSVSSVKGVGHALKNCTARNRYALKYVRDVKNGEIEMWVLRKKKRPVCQMTVDTYTRKVREIEGEDGSTPKLKQSVACAILNKLNIDGDDEESFVKVGAFQAFRNGRPDVPRLMIEGRPYWVWIMRGGAEIQTS